MKEAKAAGWREIGTLGKVYNLIVHIWASEARYNKFKTLAKQSVPLDNNTWWNSWFIVLDVIKDEQVKTAIDTYSWSWYKEIKDDYLSPEDWQIIDDTH